ncbi:MAG: hypothetical protein QW129_05135 [Thermoplasmata archaeon]
MPKKHKIIGNKLREQIKEYYISGFSRNQIKKKFKIGSKTAQNLIVEFRKDNVNLIKHELSIAIRSGKKKDTVNQFYSLDEVKELKEQIEKKFAELKPHSFKNWKNHYFDLYGALEFFDTTYPEDNEKFRILSTGRIIEGKKNFLTYGLKSRGDWRRFDTKYTQLALNPDVYDLRKFYFTYNKDGKPIELSESDMIEYGKFF